MRRIDEFHLECPFADARRLSTMPTRDGAWVGLPEGLVDCIQDFLANRERRLAMGSNSRKRAEEHFNTDDVIVKMRAIVGLM